MSAMPSQNSTQRTIRLTHRAVYTMTAAVMAIVGTVCSTAAVAAGVEGVDKLALAFFMGALGALSMLVVWYTFQARTR